MSHPTPPNPASIFWPSEPRKFSSVPVRLVAMLCDVLPVAAIAALYLQMFVWADRLNTDESTNFYGFIGATIQVLLIGASTLGGTAIWLAMSIRLWSKSTTLGKRLTGLRVVKARSGAPATMGQMLGREVGGKWVPLAVLVLAAGGLVEKRLLDLGDSYLIETLVIVVVSVYFLVSVTLVLVTPSHQGVWDRIAHKMVVRTGWFPADSLLVPGVG